MRKQQINIIEKIEETTIFSLWKNANDKSVSKDISTKNGCLNQDTKL